MWLTLIGCNCLLSGKFSRSKTPPTELRWTIEHNKSFETLREWNIEELLSAIDKMRVLRNVWFFVLVIVIAEVARQTSSNAVEKAIKSLEKTMGNKFDMLIAAVNGISQGKPAVKPGKFCIDHYEKDWRAPLASSLHAAQSAINSARLVARPRI